MLSCMYSKNIEELAWNVDERKEHRLVIKLKCSDFKENEKILKQWGWADGITLCCFENVVKIWQAPRSIIWRKEETFKLFKLFFLSSS